MAVTCLIQRSGEAALVDAEKEEKAGGADMNAKAQLPRVIEPKPDLP